MFSLHLSVALAQDTTGVTTATTMAAAGRNGPLAPHMRPCTSRQRFKWMGDNPPSLQMFFWGGGWGCLWPSKRSFVPAMMHRHNIGVFWGPYTPSTAAKITSACLGGYRPSIRHVCAQRKASCGALGGHYCRQRQWLAMVVSVDVGSWRLTSDRPTVGIVKTVYISIFFHSYVDPIYSWHLTRQLNKEDLHLCTFAFSWFLCPVFYGNLPTKGEFINLASIIPNDTYFKTSIRALAREESTLQWDSIPWKSFLTLFFISEIEYLFYLIYSID